METKIDQLRKWNLYNNHNTKIKKGLPLPRAAPNHTHEKKIW